MNPRTMLLGQRTSGLAGWSLRAAGWVCLCAPVLSAQFEDVTTAAGLTDSTASCSSAAWGDYNNDGFQDLFIVTGGSASRANLLYLNAGNASFVKAGPEAGPIVTNKLTSFGCAGVDFNNDGLRDLFVANGGWGPARSELYWNHGDETFGRGSAGELTTRLVATTFPASADYDGDGWVDLYLAEGNSAWEGPFQPRLYHATGHGTFTPVELGPAFAIANAAVWGDFDNDRDPDLFTCNYSAPSALWRNDGHGQFTKMTNGLPAYAGTAHAAWADYDRDGDLDIALSSLADTRVYRNDGADGFALGATFGGAIACPTWADYDNDGNVDLLVAAGSVGGAVKAALYHNEGDGNFARATDVFTEVADIWAGSPWGDFDNDGFMDVLLTHQSGKNRLYHNLRNANHWLKFSLTGKVSNRDAIGAKVRVLATIGGQAVWQMQEVNGGYAIQNDLRPNFGLGDATNADRVVIAWPSGNVQELTDVAADQIVSVTEIAAITPIRPSASLNGAITLRHSGAAVTRQWRFEGVDLAGQTNLALTLTNLTAQQAGRYSVVVDTGTGILTDHTYLVVDPQFTKITEGPVATDHVISWSGSWGDYDADGLLDLVVLGDYFNSGANTRLYHNDGQGRFSAVTSGPWANLTDRVLFSPWADTDNDGDLDLFLTGYEGNSPVFMQNEGGGAFARRIVDRSWTSNWIQVRGWGNAWADFDNDGLLDAAVIEYRVYPMRNNGDGTFTVLTDPPIYPQTGPTHSVQWVDYDGDGDPDLFVVYDLAASRLYRNDGGSRFTDVSRSVTRTPLGQGFNPGWGDFDNDGDLDLYFMGYNSPERFLVNQGDGTFTDWAGSPQVLLTDLGNGGAVCGDYDNDGRLDLFLARESASCRLFRNQEDGNFVEVSLGSPVKEGSATQSASWADYDNDGDLDLFVAGISAGRNYLYQNNGNGNHWLKIRLRGTASNSHAVGARVFAQATLDGKQVRQMRTITAHAAGQELEAHFGLANATKVTLLRVEWPSGTVQEFANVAANQILTLWEPPVLKAAMQPDGACKLNFRAEPNRAWQIQAASDLTAWQTLTTVTNTTVGFQYTDASAVGVGNRFYRLAGE